MGSARSVPGLARFPESGGMLSAATSWRQCRRMGEGPEPALALPIEILSTWSDGAAWSSRTRRYDRPRIGRWFSTRTISSRSYGVHRLGREHGRGDASIDRTWKMEDSRAEKEPGMRANETDSVGAGRTPETGQERKRANDGLAASNRCAGGRRQGGTSRGNALSMRGPGHVRHHGLLPDCLHCPGCLRSWHEDHKRRQSRDISRGQRRELVDDAQYRSWRVHPRQRHALAKLTEPGRATKGSQILLTGACWLPASLADKQHRVPSTTATTPSSPDQHAGAQSTVWIDCLGRLSGGGRRANERRANPGRLMSHVPRRGAVRG
ncbi:hypothetical protein GGR56DRAFT_390745 [Xylariaceae sp. FL0804]|nr:hypothetical protein GGR56DRAFT_390745 [Xylariaceae sp. FL0804]